MNVLIADDDPDLRELVAIAVRKAGLDVVAGVGTGTEAWAVLQDAEIDLAVLDISMPGMTGLEVLRLVRADGRLQNLPVLVITANGAPGIAEEVRLAGGDDLITKPFQVRDLARSLRELAGPRR